MSDAASVSLRLLALARTAAQDGDVAPLAAELSKLDPEQRAALLGLLDALLPETSPRGTQAAAVTADATPAAQALRERASLQLQLAERAERIRTLEGELRRKSDEHAQAMQTMAGQQQRAKELTDERSRLLAEVGELESKLRLQINLTEQCELKYRKLQSSRQQAGDHAVGQMERVQALEQELERARAEIEQFRQRGDSELKQARQSAADASENTADAAFSRLWAAMGQDFGELFVPTHVPHEETFGRLGNAVIEFLQVLCNLEAHVHGMLKDLRQVAVQNDPLAHFYNVLTKSPRLVDMLRDFLVTGRGRRNFADLLRAHYVWSVAFTTGLNKAVIRSDVLAARELNPRDWPLEKSMLSTQDHMLGKYYREVALKAIPEKLATELKKIAASMAYDDYRDMMSQRR